MALYRLMCLLSIILSINSFKLSNIINIIINNNNNINNNINIHKCIKQISINLSILLLSSNIIHPQISNSLTYPIESNYYSKGLISIQPSDDFWYPPYLIGKWKTSLLFNKGEFTDRIPIETLGINNNLPGFSKYSIAILPNIGKDITTILRFIQLDSHPRQDYSYNTRSLMISSDNDIVIDSAPYSYQLSSNWFSVPSNDRTITYHDSNGKGIISLHTEKRDVQVNAGTIETIEFIKQIHKRENNNDNKIEVSYSDYALNWKISVPESSRDEFITVDKLRQTKKLIGSLDILLYIQPTNDLYIKVPAKPAGVFSYDVTMDRIDEPDIIEKTTYPYVQSEDGPVELTDFFGY
jgi:hypothetical protein